MVSRHMRGMGRIAVFAMMAATALASGLPAGAAERMTFRLTNQAKFPVWVEFYSSDRLKQWPDDGRLFILADSAPKKFTVPCELGERICYGAWKEGDVTHDWGAGYEGRKDCDDCCHICEPNSEMPEYPVTFP